MKLRALIPLLVLLFACAEVRAAITLNQKANRKEINNSSTGTILFDGSMNNPSLIVVIVTVQRNGATITSVSDNLNAGNYTQDVTLNTSGTAGGAGTVAIFSKQNTQTSSLSVTANLSAGAYGSMTAYEFKGAATSNAFDKSATQSILNSGGAPSLSFSGLAAGDAVVAGMIYYYTSCVGYTGVDTGFAYSLSASSYGYNCTYDEYDASYAAGGSLTLTYGGIPNAASSLTNVAAAYKAAGSGAPTSSQMFFSRAPKPLKIAPEWLAWIKDERLLHPAF